MRDLDEQQDLAFRLEYVQSALYPMRVDNMANSSDIDPFVPWFLACNKQRFPYWFGRPDPRNAVLASDLRRFRSRHRFSVTNKCPFLYNLAYVTVNGSSFGAVRTCPETAGA